MQKAQKSAHAPQGVVRVTNRAGMSPFVLVCDHASNHLPPQYGTLGLAEADMLRHIAWDPGALPVARADGARCSTPRWSRPACRGLPSTATGRSTRPT